ncbi:MAG TPA: NUDIX domain-containing protein, partial [Acidimicrobiales bacterium]|nr:NUDIX domain-containing protein [Acidimicrobiales bacterium]
VMVPLPPEPAPDSAALTGTQPIETQPTETQPTPAATVVPLRDGPGGLEVLLLRRNARGVFGGMWVFPGGQVDAGDRADSVPLDGEDAEIAGARRAAIREAREEAGLHLQEQDLVTLSFWIPPPDAPRRFATWFFLAEASGEVVIDEGEIHDHQWLYPRAAMAARDAGDVEMAPPTFTTLWWVARHADVESALEAAGSRPPERFATHLGFSSDRKLAATLWEGDAGYDDADVEKPGPRRRLWMDPGAWRVEIDG